VTRYFSSFLLGFSVLVASAAQAADWSVDQGQSRVGFSGVQTGTPFKGAFSRYKTAIAFDPAHLDASHMEVTVDLGSAATGDSQRDTAMPGKDWFDVAAFPQATFRTTAIRRTGADTYVADGTLDLRGVSKPVVLVFSVDIQGVSAHAKGHVDLVRSAFGVGQGPWASGQWVALAVGVDLDIVAHQR